MKKARRYVFLALIVAASVGVSLLAEAKLTAVEGAERALLGWRQTSVAQSKVETGDPSKVVLVLFDSMSVAEWPYLSPFPRPFLAQLIDALSAAGAKAIGLDVFLDRTYPGLDAMDHGDQLLHDAIQRAGNVVLVSRLVTTDAGPVLERPHPYFADVAAGVAAAEVPTPFETVQDATLAVRSGEHLAPAFALALWARAQDLSVDSVLRAAEASRRLDLPGLPEQYGTISDELLTGNDYALVFPLRFIGPPSVAEAQEGRVNTFETHSGSLAATTASFLPEAFRDRIVLLGTGFHDSDKFRTPFYDVRPAQRADTYGWMYGVEIHANAIENLLDGRYLRAMPDWAKLLMLLALAGFAAVVSFKWEAAVGAIASVALALLVVLGGFWAYAGEVFVPGRTLFHLGAPYLVLPMTASLLAIVLSYLGSVAYISVVEGADKRYIKNAFKRYVSPDMVDEIAENPEALKLGGSKKELTILFSDLAGFTDLSEKLDPEDLIKMINEYLSEMTDIVLDERGTLDKYIGDAIMAFWNAPLPLEGHADHALRCAVLMQRKIIELNARWQEADPSAKPLVVRIGVNTGTVVVGNVGGETKTDFTALGDAVNLAARLEPANKTYDTYVMVSEYTMKAATPSAYRYREIDLITVKGKLKPVIVYEILELADAPLPGHRDQALRHYDSGLVAYKRRDWELAATYFEAALASDPADGPSAVYLERCRENVANPPPADWDFVVRRTVK